MDAKELIDRLSVMLEGPLTKEVKEAVKNFYLSLDENCWYYIVGDPKILIATAQELIDQLDDDKERAEFLTVILSKVPKNLKNIVKMKILSSSLLYHLNPRRFIFKKE